jgi:homospermidine synthase
MLQRNRRESKIGREHRALVVGCHGGVGRAVLALLNHSAVGRRLHGRLSTVILVDREEAEHAVPLKDAVLLPATTLRCADDLARLVCDHRITQVIDLSSVDTVDCTRACDELGADFLCTSVEEWSGRGPIPTDEAISRLVVPGSVSLRQSHLVGTGANPGIVNALAFVALQEFASRVGVTASAEALDLHGIVITEEDTTTAGTEDGADDVFPMTWSPTHCLEELFEPRAFAAHDGQIVSLGHAPTGRWYRARCGSRLIDGMAVPHEEIATLARRFPTVEIAFIYRIPVAARRALAAQPNRPPEAWPTRRLCPPWTSDLSGMDRVGVLLCSRRFGEFWMGFETNVAEGLAIGTNATQLQVAAGVIAGWTQLGREKGIHFVEDLDCRRFLDTAGAVLGRPLMIHDRLARPKLLADRVLSAPRLAA